jgi:hypothetical protein
MRFIASFAALSLLAACAATVPATQTTEARPIASAPAQSRIAQMLSNAGRDSAPTRSEVERLLGEADIARQDGAGAALTYRYQNCALLLVFAADQRNALRLAEAHPSARRTGETAPSIDQCAAEADQRR